MEKLTKDEHARLLAEAQRDTGCCWRPHTSAELLIPRGNAISQAQHSTSERIIGSLSICREPLRDTTEL